MALASTVLVLTEHAASAEVRSAGLWYAVMTHLSFLLVLLGFAVLAHAGGGTSFAAMATVPADSPTAGAAFVLLVLGFATKAGLVPVHVWLPRAHPAAPSHVSAVMSAAMVKMGVYGALLVTVALLPGGPSWWGLLLMALGAVSAVYGILQASVATDIKRLLAYSTTENVGLIFLALGAGVLLRSYGVAGPADAAIAACLLLVGGPRRVQDHAVPGRWVGRARHRRARPRPHRRARVADAGHGRGVRHRRARCGRAARHLRIRGRVGAAPVADPRGRARKTGWSPW